MADAGGVPDLTIGLKMDATAWHKGAEAAMGAARKIEDAQLSAARKVEDAAKRSARAQEDAAKVGATAVERAALRATRAQEDAATKMRRAQEDAATKIGRAHADAAAKVSEGAGQMAGAFGRLDASVGSLLGRFTLLSGARAAWAGIADMIARSQQRVHEMADDVLKVRDALRQGSFMQGMTGTSNEELQKFGELRTFSGMNLAEAAHYREEFLGSGEANRGNFKSDAEYQKAMLMGGRLATVSGGDPGATANLMGVEAGFMGKGLTAAGVTERAGRTFALLNPGRGTTSQNVAQFTQTMPTYLSSKGEGFGLANEDELAILNAAASRVNPGEQATLVNQLARSVRGFQRDIKRGHFADDSQAAFLQKAGVTQDMGIMQSLERIMPQIAAAEARGLKPDYFLKKEGFRNEEDVRALKGTYENWAFIQQQRGAAAGMPTGGIEGRLEGAMQQPEFAARVGAAKLDVAKNQRAVDRGYEGNELALSVAQREMVRGGYSESTYGDIMDKLHSLPTFGQGRRGREETMVLDLQRRMMAGEWSGSPAENAAVMNYKPGVAGAFDPNMAALMLQHLAQTAAATQQTAKSLESGRPQVMQQPIPGGGRPAFGRN